MAMHASGVAYLGRIMLAAFLAIPTLVGLFSWSWLWFFCALLVECVLFLVLIKIDNHFGLSRRWLDEHRWPP
jgi:hypothetical protein